MYSTKLSQIQKETGSIVCVGLDPDPERIPGHLLESQSLNSAIVEFASSIVEATSDFAPAYKINFAFFEGLGVDGMQVLSDVKSAIPANRIVIADAKRGDIGNTARFYARSVYDDLGFDAVTVNPYMGSDAVTPFLDYPETATYILIRTSNPGAAAIQRFASASGQYLYEYVANAAEQWREGLPAEIGFVTGATDVNALQDLRDQHADRPLLIPGVGAQGGDVDVVKSIAAKTGAPVLVNSSRGILYASSGRDYADAAREACLELRRALSG